MEKGDFDLKVLNFQMYSEQVALFFLIKKMQKIKTQQLIHDY